GAEHRAPLVRLGRADRDGRCACSGLGVGYGNGALTACAECVDTGPVLAAVPWQRAGHHVYCAGSRYWRWRPAIRVHLSRLYFSNSWHINWQCTNYFRSIVVYTLLETSE